MGLMGLNFLSIKAGPIMKNAISKIKTIVNIILKTFIKIPFRAYLGPKVGFKYLIIQVGIKVDIQ